MEVPGVRSSLTLKVLSGERDDMNRDIGYGDRLTAWSFHNSGTGITENALRLKIKNES